MVAGAGAGARAAEPFSADGLAQLLGAVLSKLIFSFLLGALLAVLTILSGLSALGWWDPVAAHVGILVGAAYLRRHQVIGAAAGAPGGEHVRRPRSLDEPSEDCARRSTQRGLPWPTPPGKRAG